MRHVVILESTPAPYMPGGKAWRARCRFCGTQSPYAGKEQAELAKKGHEYETTPPGGAA